MQLKHNPPSIRCWKLIASAAVLLTLSPAFVCAQSVTLFSAQHQKGKKPKPRPARDAERDWANTGSDFNTNANWTVATGGVAPGAGDTAWFKAAASFLTPNLSSSVSIAGIYFNGTGSNGYDITATGGAAFTLTGQTTGTTETTNTNSAAIRGDNTSGTNTIDVPITLAPASGTTSVFNQASGGTLAVNGIISGSGITLRLNNSGIVQLNGANTYSGGTNVTGGGTLQIGNNSALGSGTLTLTSTNGAVLQAVGGSRTIANAFALDANATISGNNDLTFNGAMTLTSGSTRTLTITNSGTTTWGGNVFLSDLAGTGRTLAFDGTGSVVLSGAIANFNGSGSAGNVSYVGTGSLTLSGANTYSGGTTLSSGTLNLNSTSAIGTGAFTINGGTIDNTSSGAITLSTNNAVTWGSNFAFGGTQNLNLGTGAISVTMTADKTITLNGTNSILTFGGTVQNTGTSAGTLFVNGAGNTLSLGGWNLSSSSTTRTLNIGGTGNVTVTGAIANGGTATLGNLVYGGTGILTLAGPNTYTGTTTVNGGKLFVNGSTSASSAVTVANNSGTVLGGSGTIGGSVTFNGAGKLAPGASGDGSTAKLTVGSLTLASTSTFSLDLNGTVAGTNYDQLVVNTGAVNLNSATLSLNSISGLAVGNKLAILDKQSAGAISGTFNGLAVDGSSFSSGTYTFKIFYDGDAGTLAESGGNDIILEVTAVPEPSTYVAAGLACLTVAYGLRRRLTQIRVKA